MKGKVQEKTPQIMTVKVPIITVKGSPYTMHAGDISRHLF